MKRGIRYRKSDGICSGIWLRTQLPATLLVFCFALQLATSSNPVDHSHDNHTHDHTHSHYVKINPAAADAATAEKPPIRTKSDANAHYHCIKPEFHPKEPSKPHQVHLALTSQPGEMNITWITYSDVYTYVEYWKFGKSAGMYIDRLKADRVKHVYSDVGDCSNKNLKNLNKIRENVRYIHTITLTNLADNQRYEYRVGACIFSEEDCECTPSPEKIMAAGVKICQLNRDKLFNFTMFPWSREADLPFTIAVFGDLGLKKPGKRVNRRGKEIIVHDIGKVDAKEERSFDSLEPETMQPLIELVHRQQNPNYYMLGNKPGHSKILHTHKERNSSGLEMQSVQLILHIGDIAYDLHEWRKRTGGRDHYNLGDRFMNIMEDVAAYVPYMVIAGNHENEENKAERPDPPGAESHFDPQYEHFESRFNMPRMFHKHDTNQFYHFTYGPIWFLCVSTEFYYSYSIKEPVFHYISDLDRVREQYDFLEYSLMQANLNRQRFPFIVVVQHRPYYCTSTNKITCKLNKLHKDGIKDPRKNPDDPEQLHYGLEALFAKYHVDLIVTGHEHTFEMFPPIQLRDDGKSQVIPYKYWWHAFRHIPAEVDPRTGNTKTNEHQFMAFTDPVAPIQMIVGRPGNDEEIEVLTKEPHLQRVISYDGFAFLLVHYAGKKKAKKSMLALRVVDALEGKVVQEFMLEKTFTSYHLPTVCSAIDRLLAGYGSMYALERSKLVDQWATFRPDQKFLRKRAKFDKVVVEKARNYKEVKVAGNGKAKVAAAAATNGEPREEEPPTTETETINVPSEMPVFYFDKERKLHVMMNLDGSVHPLEQKASVVKMPGHGFTLERYGPRVAAANGGPTIFAERILEQEIAPGASANTKVRALVQAFNLRRESEDPDLGALFWRVKKTLCRVRNYEESPLKYDSQRFRELEDTFSPSRPAAAEEDRKPNVNVKVRVHVPNGANSSRVTVRVKTTVVRQQQQQQNHQQRQRQPVHQAATATTAMPWSSLEAGALADLLAHFYLEAVNRGQCHGFKLFRLSIDRRTGLRRLLYLDRDQVQAMIHRFSRDSCFRVDYYSDDVPHNLWDRSHRDYRTLLDQLFRSKNLTFTVHELQQRNAGGQSIRHPTTGHQLFSSVDAAVILRKVQSSAANIFTSKATLFAVTEPALVSRLLQGHLYL